MKAERTDRALFFESLLKWGIESQFLMVVEECAELQHVILKRFRGQQNDNKLAEEIADVQFMIDEIITVMGLENMVATWRTIKRNRLEGLLYEDSDNPQAQASL